MYPFHDLASPSQSQHKVPTNLHIKTRDVIKYVDIYVKQKASLKPKKISSFVDFRVGITGHFKVNVTRHGPTV